MPTALEAVPTGQPGENAPFGSMPVVFSSPCSTTLVLASVDCHTAEGIRRVAQSKIQVYHVVVVVEGVGVDARARARCVIVVVRVLVLEVGWSFVLSLSPLGAVLKSSWSPSPLDAAAGAIVVAIVVMVWGLGTCGGGVTCQHWGIVGLVTLVLVVVVASDLFTGVPTGVPVAGQYPCTGMYPYG